MSELEVNPTSASTKHGKVYLLGAGPGNIDHLTLRGHQCLTQAEALVYDALVDSALLQTVPPTCELWPMGKRGGQPSKSQAEINQQLIALCQAGKQVVRLKSGDPFIFGRATAEIQALQSAGCDFEVIPGLSSVIAAPLLAGIPLTDPVLARGFGAFTAHDLDALDWTMLARLEMLVLLMGGQKLRDICDRLLVHGKRPETPMAIIRWASQPQQQIWQGTLLNMPQRVGAAQLSPCVLVIGEAVGLRQYLAPPASASSPLAGKTILVTRAATQAGQFNQMLQAKGARVIDFPALEIRPPQSWQAVDDAIAALPSFHWLILTSANAVDYFLDRLLAQGKDWRALNGLKIAVVGKKTKAVLAQRGLLADFTPPTFVADSLIEHFPEDPAGLNLLFPRVEQGGREVLVQQMSARGANVTEVAAYESACPDAIAPAAKQAFEQQQHSPTFDAITFASSKTVRHFAQLMGQTFGPSWRSYLNNVAIASIGPQTSRDCQEIFGHPPIEATEYTLPGLVQALELWAKNS
jgi:uroporphyrinogen III methyltransferase / synthase